MKILNTRSETYPLKEGTTPVTLIAVLTCGVLGEGSVNDTAVYVGTVDLGDCDSDKIAYAIRRANAESWIAHNGIKQTLRGARRYFPDLTESEYRV